MRKMTKTVAVLAAMSAMTVASASLAFAAEKQVEGLTGGTWAQQSNGSWKFKTEDGVQLKDTWAEIDGVWYYFDGETMAQDKFLILDEKGYFFDNTGRLATGWQKITSKMDAYSDIDISEDLYYPSNNAYTQVDDDHEYDYHDFVWCYFDENGVAKENEWFQDASGLWYYFDGNVMVKNVFNYEVNPDNYDVTASAKKKYYGFDENGAMLVGWNSKKTPTTRNNPTADAKGDVWYYYKDNGQMQTAGWAQIGDDWYLFADEDADGKDIANGDYWIGTGFPLIVNSYVASYKNGSSAEYFYVDGKGKLQSGVQNVKKAYKVLFYNQNGTVDVAYEQIKVADKDIKVNFSDKGYAAKDGIKDNSYYALSTTNIYKTTFGAAKDVTEINNKLLDATNVFADYKTLNKTAWSFTDAGDALDSTVTDATIAGYVNKTDFTILSKTLYDEGIAKKPGETGYVDASEYFAMAASDKANTARNNANDAYIVSERTKTNYNTKKAAWDALVGTSTVAVTGYDATIAPGLAAFENNAQTYNALVAAKDAKRTAADTAYENWQLAIASEASDATITARKNAYITADAEAAEYEKACTSVEGEALFGDIMSNKAVYDAYKTAEKNYADANANYVDAKAAAMKYDYKYFENKWDTAVDSLPTDFAVVGELVKNAFIGTKDDLYVTDANGEFVTNKAILIDDNANITHTDKKVYNNAYLVFGSDGKAARGYEGTKKTIVIGGVSYWATGETLTVGKSTATVFVANKNVNNQK